MAYKTIVVDPPWPQKGAGRPMSDPGQGEWADRITGSASRPMPYKTMTLLQIADLQIIRHAHPDGCHLYLWTTNRFAPEAFSMLNRWGFVYSTMLVWAKNPMGGGLGGAYGISTEYVLYGRYNALPAISRNRGTWFNWKRPYNAAGKPMHSAKPQEFFEMVERVSPGPRLEMFARRTRPGWDAWGDQAPEPVDLPALRSSA